jgi:alpha-L-fucosidase 2
MDANMGFVNAIQEMLFYSSADTVKFLPALPSSFNKGSVRDFRFVTGRVSFSWNVEDGLFNAVITADRDTDISFRLPDFCSGYNAAVADNTVRVTLKAGETFKIASK